MKKEEIQKELDRVSKVREDLRDRITILEQEIKDIKDEESKEVQFLKDMVLHLTSKQEEIRDKDGIIRKGWVAADSRHHLISQRY